MRLVLIFLTVFFFSLKVSANVEKPSACDCETIVVSGEEAANGCPDHVKEKICPLYRTSEAWKEWLRTQQENRLLEEKVRPRGIPVK